MSIIIHNLGGDLNGLCEYELCINQTRLTTFTHNRPDGLERCLLEAARAAKRAKIEETDRLLTTYLTLLGEHK